MSSAAAPVVELAGVSKAYGSGPDAVRVLDGVDLLLHEGETTSLLGRSGSGKSTLLSVMAGLLRADTGQVRLGGQPLDGLSETARARLRAERVGVVLQADNLIPFLTARENVELALDLHPHRPPRRRAVELVTELGLADRVDHLPRQLSGGEAQRVAVAVALAGEPDLLLADEVVGQLDTGTAAEVMELLFTASRERGLTVLYVTHDEVLARAAARALRLTDGRIVPA